MCALTRVVQAVGFAEQKGPHREKADGQRSWPSVLADCEQRWHRAQADEPRSGKIGAGQAEGPIDPDEDDGMSLERMTELLEKGLCG